MEKNFKIEIFKLFATAGIMFSHIFLHYNSHYDFLFQNSWNFVEFFFMLTGFFTVRHFANTYYGNNKLLHNIGESYKYLIKKYSRYIPYTFFAVTVLYWSRIFINLINKNFFKSIRYFFSYCLETCFLGELVGNLNFPMWYMSILFIVLPIFILIIMYTRKNILLIISMLYYVTWFLLKKDFGHHDILSHLLRCFAGLFMGVIIYFIVEKIKIYKNQYFSVVITLLEIISFLLPCIFMPLFHFNIRLLLYACFVLFITCSFSGLSYVPNLKNNNIISCISQISLSLYVWHSPIITIFRKIQKGNNYFILICLIIAISTINVFCVNVIKNIKK